MKKMGFRDKWCKWVDSCLRSASMSILVNGSPSEEFRLKRGIRQGDPLSHFLFILAAEGLNALVSEAVEKGIFRGVAVGEDNVTVSHLQYADDTIFFEEWNKENAKSLMCILKCFEEDSGLRVNYNKSKIYGIGVNEGEMSDMARWMRCEIGEFPFTYLGLPIRENMKRVNAWYPVVEKFKKRLASWKTKTMSFAGRLTLVKSVLGSLQLYYFLIFRVPLNVIKNLERIRKNFFWGELGAGKKLSWVKWDSILLFVRGRGLNVGSLRAKNLPLLGQWKGVSRDGVWGNIVKIGEEIDGLGVEFASSCVGILGDGRDIRRKETSVMDKGGWVNNSWVWKWDRDRWRWSLGEDALKGRLPVRVELDKRGVDLDSVLCPSCKNIVETCAHSLITCDLAMSVWDKIFSWWKVGCVNAFFIDELFSSNGNVNIHIYFSRVWQSVIWTTGYFIWKERNVRVFSNKVADLCGCAIIRDLSDTCLQV
ncbi:reverse transcriptase domain, reverse transcriptase zinc-binding domain protein [Tanacetum coccineum]